MGSANLGCGIRLDVRKAVPAALSSALPGKRQGGENAVRMKEMNR